MYIFKYFNIYLKQFVFVEPMVYFFLNPFRLKIQITKNSWADRNNCGEKQQELRCDFGDSERQYCRCNFLKCSWTEKVQSFIKKEIIKLTHVSLQPTLVIG